MHNFRDLFFNRFWSWFWDWDWVWYWKIIFLDQLSLKFQIQIWNILGMLWMRLFHVNSIWKFNIWCISWDITNTGNLWIIPWHLLIWILNNWQSLWLNYWLRLIIRGDIWLTVNVWNMHVCWRLEVFLRLIYLRVIFFLSLFIVNLLIILTF